MKKPPKKPYEESEEERAHLRKQIEISLMQMRMGYFVTEEESLAMLEEAEEQTNHPAFVATCLESGFDLIQGKKYRVISDPEAEAKGHLCVIDESGEDYVYLARRFTMNPNLLDKVKLLHSTDGLPQGCRGVVVDIIEPDSLMVEFFDDDNNTIDVLALTRLDVRLIE